MKRLIKTGLLLGLIFLLAPSAWALPIDAGDKIKMSVGGPAKFTITNQTSPDDWTSYYTFCLERYATFNNYTTYTVESVADYATGGGGGAVGGKDYLSDQTKWLYASYFDGVFGGHTSWKAEYIQNAIWYLEGEASNYSGYWNYFNNNWGSGGYDTTGWDIQAVNIVLNGQDKQSQLVGVYNPVPEPATMILFGIGLLGIAGIGRKKTNK